MKIALRIALAALMFASFAAAQVATGTPAFGSYSGGPDVTNLGNLNVHLAVPVFSRPGRNIPFSYTLAYDSSIWTPTSVSGVLTWNPVDNWGWAGQTQVLTGYVPYRTVTARCFNADLRRWYNYTEYSFDGYYDKVGIFHAMGGIVWDAPVTCPDLDSNDSEQSTSSDGYQITMYTGGTATVTAPNGSIFNPPSVKLGSPAGTITDSNGNQSSTNGSGVFTDTLGTTALTLTGSGTPSSSYYYTYTDSTGTSRSVIVSYASYTVRTNFGCSGVSEYGPTTVNLVDKITFPDDPTYPSSYQFTYEATPGYTGDVTGRPAQVTLPTGGTIKYSYTGGNYNTAISQYTGVICADGSTSGITRTTHNAADEVTNYVRSGSGSSWTTTITPPDNNSPSSPLTGNQTVINFQKGSDSNFYETSRTNYTSSTTVVGSTSTCYNGGSCTLSLPISSVGVITTLANSFESQITTAYNSYGLPTDVYEYDFGSTTGTVGALLRHTVTAYDSTLTANGIVDHPSSVTVKDGSGTQVALTTFTYDGTTPTATSGVPMHASVGSVRGNPTSISVWRNLPSSSYLTTTNTYYDTGMLKTSQDPGGHTTTFSYTDNWQACGSATNPSGALAFVTQVTDALSHASSAKYYPCIGQQYASTDPNSNTTYQTYDSILRPLVTTRPDGGTTTNSYFTPSYTGSFAQFRQQVSIDSSHSTDFWLAYDGYGREEHRATYNAEANPWDEVSTCYDNMGRVNFISYPVQNSGASTGCTGAGDTYTYFYSGATAYQQVTHSDSTFAFAASYGRASISVDEGNGSGSTRIEKISQIDGLGRITSVCEMSSVTQLGADPTQVTCPMDFSGYSGFMTTYTYDILDNLIAINQGTIAPHTRTFTYDSVSRMLTANTPEQGLICYGTETTSGTCDNNGYNNDGNLLYRTRLAPNQTGSATVTTTNSYDSLHRLTQTSYSDGTTPTIYLTYDETAPWGVTAYNTKGQLTTAANSNGGAVYSYDSMGRVGYTYIATPSVYGTSSYYMSFAYDYLGDITSLYNGGGGGVTMSSNYNQAGRLTSITSSLVDSTHPATLLSNVNYNALGQAINLTGGASISSGVKTSFTYDANGMGRMASKNSVNSGGSGTSVYSLNTPSSPMSYAPNGSLTGVADSVNGTWSYVYDEFNRLSTATKGTNVYAYLYDRYGNRWKTQLNGVTQQNLSFDSTNRVASGNGISYDAAGNVTSDAVSDPGHTHTYTYDAENRVISIDSGSWTYQYDGLGHRTRRNNGSNYYEALYDLSGNLVTERDNGIWARTEIYAGGMRLATYSGAQTNFVYSDWLGTHRTYADQTGTAFEACSGLPFGDGVSCASPLWDSELFTGDEHDSESNTEHTDFRQMSGTQGRWLSPDPYMGSMNLANPQSMNRYAYVGNDPVDSFDPSGLLAAAPPPPLGPVVPFAPFCSYDDISAFCKQQNCNQTFVSYDGGDYTGGCHILIFTTGGGGGKRSKTKPSKTPPTPCSGAFQVIQGNRNFIGTTGALIPNKITNQSIAVDPSQFGGTTGNDLRSFANSISGSVSTPGIGSGRFVFSGITDVVNDDKTAHQNGIQPGAAVRSFVRDRGNGALVLELPGLAKGMDSVQPGILYAPAGQKFNGKVCPGPLFPPPPPPAPPNPIGN